MSPKKSEKRSLPKKLNPLLAPDKTPTHIELVKKRRLGQTKLAVKADQVGTTNATRPEHLGRFDYAHLRAPLPDNLKGSEVFAHQSHQPHPEAYFLMRRSHDGFISATGMFKAAFPWAKTAEEEAERDYIKSLQTTSLDEVAGNVWIPEVYALELAEEYGIEPWIMALLDNAPIPENLSPGEPKKSIDSPPKFVFRSNDDDTPLPPINRAVRSATPRARGRPRGISPVKNGSVASKMASPRKPRGSKAAVAANAASAREASASLQSTADTGASVADSDSVDGGDKATLEIGTAVQVNGDVKTTTTNVKIQMPGGSADFPLPEDPEEMIAQAKEMVKEAQKLDGQTSAESRSLKRKAEELEEDDTEDEEIRADFPPTKKARLLEHQLKKEKVRKRALLGVAATLVIGAIFPLVW